MGDSHVTQGSGTLMGNGRRTVMIDTNWTHCVGGYRNGTQGWDTGIRDRDETQE